MDNEQRVRHEAEEAPHGEGSAPRGEDALVRRRDESLQLHKMERFALEEQRKSDGDFLVCRPLSPSPLPPCLCASRPPNLPPCLPPCLHPSIPSRPHSSRALSKGGADAQRDDACGETGEHVARSAAARGSGEQG